MSGKTSNIDLEWQRRVLCSDEACIGTIGPDGTCRECGKPYEGQLPDALLQSAEDSDAPEPSPMADDAVDDVADEAPADQFEDLPPTSPAGDEWERRTLCIDESCIGVIGPDGLCKECGKPYKQA